MLSLPPISLPTLPLALPSNGPWTCKSQNSNLSLCSSATHPLPESPRPPSRLQKPDSTSQTPSSSSHPSPDLLIHLLKSPLSLSVWTSHTHLKLNTFRIVHFSTKLHLPSYCSSQSRGISVHSPLGLETWGYPAVSWVPSTISHTVLIVPPPK